MARNPSVSLMWRMGISLGVVVLCVLYAFLKDVQYRKTTSHVLGEIMEANYHSFAIREEILKAIVGAESQDANSLAKELTFLKIRVATLANWEYIDKFVPSAGKGEFKGVAKEVDTILQALHQGRESSSLPATMANLLSVRDEIMRITGFITDRSHDLADRVQLEGEAWWNTALFAFAILLVAMGVGLLVHLNSLTSRRNQESRSFASLFGHMTRTRLAALGLFIRALERNEAPNREIIDAAASSVGELNSINDQIMSVVRPNNNIVSKERLEDLFDEIRARADARIWIGEIPIDRNVYVAAPHLRLILNELVYNAQCAIETVDRRSPKIEISCRLRGTLWHYIVVEVKDNGCGMTPEVRNKATTAFFSTRAGEHIGLGLTECLAMVNALMGRLSIVSAFGKGTTVQVRLPCWTKGDKGGGLLSALRS
jgi:signal transduction histidine kinase